MTFVAFAGPFLLGVGPLITLFVLFIARKAFIVLLSLASAFYWLIVLLALAAAFRGVVPFAESAGVHAGVLLTAVFIEQVANYGLYKFNTVLKRLLEEAGRKLGHGFTAIDALWLSFGMGFGHAAIHTTCFFVSLLESTSTGVTSYDFTNCPELSYNVSAALLTLGLSLFHAFSTVIFFEGLSSKDPLQIALPPAAHLTAALLTLLNFSKHGCLYSIPLVLVIGVGSALWAAGIAWREIKRQFPLQSF